MSKNWLLPLALIAFSSAHCKESSYCYNYSCLPTSTNNGSLFLEGGALLLQADGNGLGYAMIITEVTEANGAVVNHTKNYDLDFNWEFASRLGVGCTLPQNGWDLKGYWTHFFTIAKSAFHLDQQPINTTVSTFWNTNTFNLSALSCLDELNGASIQIHKQTAMGKWRWNLDDFSLLLGKSYFPTQCFAMRPFIGLRALSSRQNYESNLEQEMTLILTSLGSQNFTASPSSTSRCNFEGFGIQGGFEMRWFFFECLDLFATLSLSSVRGNIRSGYDEGGHAEFFLLSQEINLNTLILNTKTSSHFLDWKTIYDLTAGFKIGVPVYGNRAKISIYSAFEEHLFSNFNHFRPLTSTNSNLPNFTAPQGDLSLWGISAGIMVDF